MRRLYIIGNGFDLHHGIPSSYGCFKCYLNRVGCTEHIQILDYLFGDNKLWSDFEIALGLLSPSRYQNFVEWYKQTDRKRGIPDLIAQENATDQIYSFIEMLFREWIQQLSLDGIKPKVNIYPGESVFLNFNYTPTLEKIYNVPTKQIVYIHNTSDYNPIFGHGLNDSVIDGISSSIEDKSLKAEFKSLLKSLRKNPEENIQNKMAFFNNLSNISEVFVLGHSLADVDLPYFKLIEEKISHSAIWTVSVYDNSCPKERLEKEIQLTKIGITPNRIYYRKLNEL
ncbi:MAG: bacteriophage abortive infection AbiH family protein [Bacteroidaceae bacterium]|nr:bacteriophage abortive infection AbiH family protein [Bacteroidaceae bacterium]